MLTQISKPSIFAWFFYANNVAKTSSILPTKINLILCFFEEILLYLEVTKLLYPNFSASKIRWSILETGLISPAKPTSAAKQTFGLMAISWLLDKIAATTETAFCFICHSQCCGIVLFYCFVLFFWPFSVNDPDDGSVNNHHESLWKLLWNPFKPCEWPYEHWKR